MGGRRLYDNATKAAVVEDLIRRRHRDGVYLAAYFWVGREQESCVCVIGFLRPLLSIGRFFLFFFNVEKITFSRF